MFPHESVTFGIRRHWRFGNSVVMDAGVDEYTSRRGAFVELVDSQGLLVISCCSLVGGGDGYLDIDAANFYAEVIC